MSEMRQVWMTEDGWVAERLDGCTCSPHYGHHEPTCGWEPIGKLNDAAPLRAAIGALDICQGGDEQTEIHARYCVPFYEARDAILADDGAAALREHDRRILAEQGKRLAKEYRRRADQTDEMRAATSDGNPMRGVWHGEASAYRYAADYAEYRDTAKEAGDE